MALTIGVNCGLILTRPTTDPAGSTTSNDESIIATKIYVPMDMTITEIGCYIDNATEAANFEVGIYEHNEELNMPTNLLSGANQTNAKGLTAGWKYAAVNIRLYKNNFYWLAFQLDNTATTTNTNSAVHGNYFARTKDISTNGKLGLINPLSSNVTITTSESYAIYAIYELVDINAKSGEKELNTNYDELTASDSTKKIGHKQSLIPKNSNVLNDYKII